MKKREKLVRIFFGLNHENAEKGARATRKRLSRFLEERDVVFDHRTLFFKGMERYTLGTRQNPDGQDGWDMQKSGGKAVKNCKSNTIRRFDNIPR